MTREQKKHLITVAYHVFILLLAFIVFYPVLWLIASSLKTQAEIWQNSHSLIPSFQWENYRIGWEGFGRFSFAVFFRNSFIITITSTIGQVSTSALVAYGFARVRFRFKKFWFTCVILTMLLPQQVLLIPQYVMFSTVGWVNTWLPLIVPSFFGLPFFIFLMLQFIRGIPHELDESAVIDGCSKYGIFFRIILPNLTPALVTAMIFSFYWKWEDFMGPLIYLQSTRLYPVSLALRMFADPAAVTNWGGMFAMSTLSLLPVFLLFVMFQKYLVEGIATTGLKG